MKIKTMKNCYTDVMRSNVSQHLPENTKWRDMFASVINHQVFDMIAMVIYSNCYDQDRWINI